MSATAYVSIPNDADPDSPPIEVWFSLIDAQNADAEFICDGRAIMFDYQEHTHITVDASDIGDDAYRHLLQCLDLDAS
jgi:hypothetical protein